MIEMHGKQAEVDVRGKRLRARITRPARGGRPDRAPKVSVNVDLQPRRGSLSELNVIGCTVDEALTRAGRFLDEAMLTDSREAAHRARPRHRPAATRHRRASCREHPLVARFELAPPNQGGGGVTVVELKD